MNAPIQFHQLPEPASRVAGRNTVESSRRFLFNKIAQLWRPKNALGEPPACTVSRFALRLISRTDGEAYSADEIMPILTVLTPSADAYTLCAPSGTFSAGARAKYHITTSVGCALTMDPAIVIPSDSTFVSKLLTAHALYIVQLEYSGSFWMLESLVGGYTQPE